MAYWLRKFFSRSSSTKSPVQPPPPINPKSLADFIDDIVSRINNLHCVLVTDRDGVPLINETNGMLPGKIANIFVKYKSCSNDFSPKIRR
jgi:Mitogen-activated protein kinase kinase 1 interacting